MFSFLFHHTELNAKYSQILHNIFFFLPLEQTVRSIAHPALTRNWVWRWHLVDTLAPVFFFWFASVKVKIIPLSAGYVSVETYFTLKRKGKGSCAKEVESWATDGGCPKKTVEGPDWEKRPCACPGCRQGRAGAVRKHQKAEREQKADEGVKRKGKAGSTVRRLQKKLPQLCVQTSQKIRHPQKYDSPHGHRAP